MNCERAQEQYSSLREGSVSQSLRMALENHLRECDGCRTEYMNFCRAWDALSTFAPVEEPPGLHDKITARLDAYEWAVERAKPQGWRLWLNRGIVYAGALSIIGFIWLALPRTSTTNDVAGGLVPLPHHSSGVKIASPRLDWAGASRSSAPMVHLAPMGAVKYSVYLFENADDLSPSEAKSSWSGTTSANGSIDMPLVNLSGEQASVLLFTYGSSDSQRSTLFILPSASSEPSPNGFNGSLSEALVQIAQHSGTAIQVDNFSDNPRVVANDLSPKAFEGASILDGTSYQLIDNKNGVIHIARR